MDTQPQTVRTPDPPPHRKRSGLGRYVPLAGTLLIVCMVVAGILAIQAANRPRPAQIPADWDPECEPIAVEWVMRSVPEAYRAGRCALPIRMGDDIWSLSYPAWYGSASDNVLLIRPEGQVLTLEPGSQLVGLCGGVVLVTTEDDTQRFRVQMLDPGSGEKVGSIEPERPKSAGHQLFLWEVLIPDEYHILMTCKEFSTQQLERLYVAKVAIPSGHVIAELEQEVSGFASIQQDHPRTGLFTIYLDASGEADRLELDFASWTLTQRPKERSQESPPAIREWQAPPMPQTHLAVLPQPSASLLAYHPQRSPLTGGELLYWGFSYSNPAVGIALEVYDDSTRYRVQSRLHQVPGVSNGLFQLHRTPLRDVLTRQVSDLSLEAAWLVYDQGGQVVQEPLPSALKASIASTIATIGDGGVSPTSLLQEEAVLSQLVYPTPATVNQGRGLIRLGVLDRKAPLIHWLGWLPLPDIPGGEPRGISVTVRYDPATEAANLLFQEGPAEIDHYYAVAGQELAWTTVPDIQRLLHDRMAAQGLPYSDTTTRGIDG